MYGIVAVGVAWVAAIIGAGVLWRVDGREQLALRIAGAATLAAPVAAACGFVGFFFGSLGGSDVRALVAEVAGEVVGGAGGFVVSCQLLSLGGRSRGFRVAIALAASALYWVTALLLDLAWLLINIMGDCFDSMACRRHNEGALSQAGVLLLVFLALYIGLFAAVRRSLARTPAASDPL
jgi:hypothetical protein